MLQRHWVHEANKKVLLQFENNVMAAATLPAKGDRHWNIIKVLR